MTRSRGIVVLALCAAIPMLSAGGLATARPGCDGRDPLGTVEHLVGELGLDAETEASIYSVLDAQRQARRDHLDEIRTARDELRALLDAEIPDEEAIFAQVDVIGALATDARKDGLRTLLEVRSLLDPEQQEALREAMEASHGQRFRDRGERVER